MDKEKTNEITNKEMSSSFFLHSAIVRVRLLLAPSLLPYYKKNAVSYDRQRNFRGGIIPWNEVSLWR